MSEQNEFSDIFEPLPNRAVMSRPPRMKATKEFIREVAAALGIADEDKARDAADWIADKMERFGARIAQPVFDMDGNGPVCSWCGALWPLCGHHHLSVVLPDDENAEG